MDLPALSADEASLLRDMQAFLRREIDVAEGSLPFDRYMESALYAPELGYYVNGRRKFGEAGDFTTAPEISSLFSHCLAQQLAECLHNLGGGSVLEIGAGSGRMAADVLLELQALGAIPERYLILELSPSLRQLQYETLQQSVPELVERVHWLDALPEVAFDGVVLGNELLDAMPVSRFRRHAGGWQELAVGADDNGLRGVWREPDPAGLEAALDTLADDVGGIADGYVSEINLRLAPWLNAVAERLRHGYLILVDYGYSRREYYHPERRDGTLICHFRHRVHADPYALPGLQDITASVDFTALASAAQHYGLSVAGYTTQAHFLLGNGIEQRVAASDPNDTRRHLQLTQGFKRLMLPGEMGERFKVMVLAREAPVELKGLSTRDLRERL